MRINSFESGILKDNPRLPEHETGVLQPEKPILWVSGPTRHNTQTDIIYGQFVYADDPYRVFNWAKKFSFSSNDAEEVFRILDAQPKSPTNSPDWKASLLP